MSDVIRVRGLRGQSRIGATPQERAAPQTLVINLDLRADLDTAGSSDDLVDTVDYAAAISSVARLVSRGERALLEKVAHEIAVELLDIRGVEGVTVEVMKQPPPVSEEVDSVSVVVERSRTSR